MLTLLILYFLALAIQLAYGLFFLPASRRKSGRPGQLPAVSILICAKNEAGNLAAHLPAVLKQTYPGAWEVLVVNDGSEDATADTLGALQNQYPQLRVVTNTGDTRAALPGKKSALDRGIREAHYDWLLLTDADCQPVSTFWLEKMISSAVNQQRDMLLGYGAYSEKPGWLNRFIRWETLHTAMLYFSFAAAGKAYMGVGRNLLYRKALYRSAMEDPEFRKLYASVPSGDDDLLINYVRSRKYAIGSCIDPKAVTVSVPPADFRQWVRQKSRHVSTGKLYPGPIKALLGGYALTHALFWMGWLSFSLSLVAGSAGDPFIRGLIWTGWLLGFLRIGQYYMLHRQWQLRFEERSPKVQTLAGDLLWLGYNIFFSPFIFFRNRKQWK